MRVRQGTRVRVAVSAAAQVVGGEETRDWKRREERAVRRGRAEPWGARARPLVAGGEYAHRGLTARPSPGEARAPAARACAARRPLERALSPRARARSLGHPPAQAPAAAPPPPPTFCRRHHSHFLLCHPLLSSPSVDYQVSARLRNLPLRPPGCTCIPPPLASEIGFMRWALVGSNGDGPSLSPLRSGAGIGVTWKGTHARDACVCVYVLCVWGGVYTTRFTRTRRRLCPQGGARMAVIWGRGLLCTLEHRLLPQWACDSVGGGWRGVQ